MKKIMIFAAMAAVTLSSCSKTDIVDTAGDGVLDNPNAITFSSSTTRATANTVEQLKGGFQVFGAQSGAWYTESGTVIDGKTNDYAHNGTSWEWQTVGGDVAITAPIWPGDIATNKMDFYAMYPADYTNITATAPTNDIKKTHTVGANRFAQTDELAAISTQVAAVPSGGTLSLTFNHILSKVDVSIEPAAGLVAYVQSIKFVGVKSNGEYDYKTTTLANQDGWAAAAAPATDDYTYRETLFAGATTAPTNMGATAENPNANNSVVAFNGGASTSAEQKDFSSTPLAGDLKLVPQTFTAVTIDTDGAAGDADGAANNVNAIAAQPYIEVLYRLETTGGEDVVGRKDITDVNATGKEYYNSNLSASYDTWADVIAAWGAATYPGYTTTNDYVTANSGVPQNTEGLYIKARFPLKSENGVDDTEDAGIDWKRGNYYIYNLLIGTGTGNGGYYADNQYYDEAGNETGLYHKGVAGNPVTPSDLPIHFNVYEGIWTSNGNTDL